MRRDGAKVRVSDTESCWPVGRTRRVSDTESCWPVGRTHRVSPASGSGVVLRQLISLSAALLFVAVLSTFSRAVSRSMGVAVICLA